MARACTQAVLPFRPRFVTPMAAVAGAVADELVGAACRAPGIARAYVNNGGDIALHLAPGAPDWSVGVALDRGGAAAVPTRAARRCPRRSRRRRRSGRGIATSGWRGRSLSLGIADSVTVLAADGARADAAATMIANAVDVDAPAIRRAPAASLRDDSDLGELPVTVDVPALPRDAVTRALAAGEAEARRCVERGLAGAVLIALQGRWRAAGTTEPMRAVA